ncbi:MAG: DUF2182 domain-containing protein [Rhodobacteraceae bacterium]|nr:DUF2182 domain-containing protein [Paracoccaceae bacterium]
MTQAHWLAVFALILVAWLGLYLMALPAEIRSMERFYGADFLAGLCTITPDAAGYSRIALMWLLMSSAMMIPTAVHAFATYEDLAQQAGKVRLWALIGGYLSVWSLFSLLAAAVQLGLFRHGFLSALGDSRSAGLSALLLALAGAYQFSPLKESCMSRCRHPLMFFMQHWQEGPWRNGLRLGVLCVGCCWALMLLAFVGGVMNIAFMGLVTLLMLVEKWPAMGARITRPLGAALLAGALYLLLPSL